MRRFALLLFLIALGARGQTRAGLERLNFFPDADGFGSLSYYYHHHEIETPQATLNTKEVNSYVTGARLSYGHRFARKLLAGINLAYESATENGVDYGVPFREHFEGHGFKEPEAFALYRLRHQTEEKGLVDLYLAYSPPGGKHTVGDGKSNRLNGRQILRVGLSHGLHEEEWEFRCRLLYEYYGQGLERNSFTRTTYDLDNYSDVTFDFSGQYRLLERWQLLASLGIIYRDTQLITSRERDRREIQAGTGRILGLGVKRSFGDWTLAELRYTNKGNDYFVKGLEENLEGEEFRAEWTLTLIQAF